MRKLSLTLVCLLFVLFSGGPTARAQQARVAEREAEWDHYALPQSTFVRQTGADQTLLFQVPSEWKSQSTEKLVFAGPEGIALNVFIEKIPDGLPLRDYVSATMQQLRSVPDIADSLIVRRTAMAGLEAREIMFDVANTDSEEISRRVIWTAVNGPQAISFLLISPRERVAEIEPYFKAIVQSVTLVDKDRYTGFAALRSAAIKDSGPTRVAEIQTLTASFTTLDGSPREANITRLAAIFAGTPGEAIDLVLDGRPMVRAAVVAAIAQSRNKSLQPFLLRALDDREPYVAVQAASVISPERRNKRRRAWWRLAATILKRQFPRLATPGLMPSGPNRQL